MVQHDFIDPELFHYWIQSCSQDGESAGCQYFHTRFDDLTEDISPYNVYGNCFPNPTAYQVDEKPKSTQRGLLRKAAKQYRKTPPKQRKYGDGGCDYDFGVEQYFFLNDHVWNSEKHAYLVC